MSTELLTERHGHTLVMTLSGPATRNALSPQVYAAGVETLNMAESNAEIRAVIITGAGEHFCGGGDLQRLFHNRTHDLTGQGANMDALHQWIEALRAFPKPIIAAVEGVAAGGGVSVALACDLIVAGENARFLTAYSQVGLSPDGGASWHLTRALGRNRALALLWLGETQSAQDWAQAGLIQQLYPAGTVLTHALALAERLNRVAPDVVASIKDLVNDASQALRPHLDQEKHHFMVNLTKPAAGAAMEAFLNKRSNRA